MKKISLFLLALVCSVGMALANTESFAFGDYKGEGKTSEGADYTMDKTDVSIGDDKFFGNNSYAHFYAGGTITITPKNGATITKVAITTSGTSYNGYESNGTYTASTGSVAKNSSNNAIVEWTGSATSAFTLAHTKQIRWYSIEVTYTPGGTQYNITVDNEIAHGEVTASAATAVENATITLTATPDFGYELSSWSVTNTSTSATITVTDNKFTMPAAAVNVSATFTELPKHTARFSVDGVIDNNNDKLVYEGAAITFPADPADIDGKKFQGWTKTQNYSDATTAPSDLCKAADMENADVTFYAVFADEVAGADEWQKITAVNQVVAGTYALISFDEAYYVPNAAATSSAPTATAVTKTDEKIIVLDAMKWTLSISNNKYTLESAAVSGSYLWGAPTNEGIRVVAQSQKSNPFKEWILETNATYGLILRDAGTNGRYLATNGTTDWRNYAIGSISNSSRAANLYKLVAGKDCSNYTTTVAVPAYTAQVLNLQATDGTSYYATFSCDKVTFWPNDVIVNTVAVNGTGDLTLFSGEDDVFGDAATVDLNGNKTGYYVPANTGILVEALSTSETYYTVDNMNVEDVDPEFNSLYPASKDKSEFADHKFYMLAYGDEAHTSSTLGFYWGAENGAAFVSRANSAYLAIPTSILAPERFVFSQNPVATGVENVATVKATKALVNGNLVIVRNGAKFNVNGMLVK